MLTFNMVGHVRLENQKYNLIQEYKKLKSYCAAPRLVLKSLPVLNPQGLHQETEQVSILFNTLGSRFPSSVTRLGVHSDHQWVCLVKVK